MLVILALALFSVFIARFIMEIRRGMKKGPGAFDYAMAAGSVVCSLLQIFLTRGN